MTAVTPADARIAGPEASFNEKCAQCGRLQDRIGDYIKEKLGLQKQVRQAEAELAERDISLMILQTQKENHKQARAELADDVDWLIDTLDFNLQESGFAQKALDKRHADLRTRAEAESGTT